MLGGMALITFWNRFAFFSKNMNYQPGVRVQRFLAYASFAILTAIWTPILFQVDYAVGAITLAGLDYLCAGIVAAVMALCRVRSLVVVLVSTSLFFLIRVLIN